MSSAGISDCAVSETAEGVTKWKSLLTSFYMNLLTDKHTTNAGQNIIYLAEVKINRLGLIQFYTYYKLDLHVHS